MEEEKIQRLHDTLSKLRRGHGLGTSSHFNFGGPDGPIATKKDADGNVIRTDGLPINGLYSNFLREGAGYDPKKAVERKYGDGRVIKRNFDDCKDDDSDSASDSDSDSSSNNSSGAKKKKSKNKMDKKAIKAVKKAEKKAAKMEAKRQAKIAKKKAAEATLALALAATDSDGQQPTPAPAPEPKAMPAPQTVPDKATGPGASAKLSKAERRATREREEAALGL